MKKITLTLSQDIYDDEVGVLIEALIEQGGVSTEKLRAIMNQQEVTLTEIPGKVAVSFDVMKIKIEDSFEQTNNNKGENE